MAGEGEGAAGVAAATVGLNTDIVKVRVAVLLRVVLCFHTVMHTGE